MVFYPVIYKVDHMLSRTTFYQQDKKIIMTMKLILQRFPIQNNFQGSDAEFNRCIFNSIGNLSNRNTFHGSALNSKDIKHTGKESYSVNEW